MDIKNKYERRLREEKEANLRLKGETGIMRKKVTSVWLFNPLTLKSDQHLISPYNITHQGHESKGNDHQLKKLLIVNQILLVSSLGNV